MYGCRKEIVYTEYPYNAVEQFSITDTKGNELKAVLRGDSIIIHWPPHQDVPERIKPTRITLSDRATISPAADEEVPFSKETSYTVTAEDGAKRTYRLYPHINQPELIIGLQYDSNRYLFSSKTGTTLRLEGEYIIPDAERTQVILIDTVTQQEFSIPMKYAKKLTYNYILFEMPHENGAGIVPGGYHVRVKSGQWTKMAGTIGLLPGKTPPDLVASYAIDQEGLETLAPGREISISYSMSGPSAKYLIGKFTYATISGYPPGSKTLSQRMVRLDLVSQTDSKVTFRLPEDLAIGTTIYGISMYNSAMENKLLPDTEFVFSQREGGLGGKNFVKRPVVQ